MQTLSVDNVHAEPIEQQQASPGTLQKMVGAATLVIASLFQSAGEAPASLSRDVEALALQGRVEKKEETFEADTIVSWDDVEDQRAAELAIVRKIFDDFQRNGQRKSGLSHLQVLREMSTISLEAAKGVSGAYAYSYLDTPVDYDKAIEALRNSAAIPMAESERLAIQIEIRQLQKYILQLKKK